MRTFKLKHLRDSVLLHELSSLVELDRVNTAQLLAYIAEVDERRLYLPAGYPSMYAYCLGALYLSEDSAYRRIRAARTAREFPAFYEAVAKGRLHLSAVLLLTPRLTPGNVDELIASATHKGRPELEQWMAGRFPRPEAMQLGDGISPLSTVQLAPAPVEMGGAELALAPVGTDPVLALGQAGAARELTPGPVEVPSRPTRLSPLSPERYSLQVTIPRTTHDKLRYAQSLLGHSNPSGEIAGVLDRALDSLIAQLERRKLGATDRPRPQPRPIRGRRHVPAAIRRAVWERDGGQCTFVGDRGRRCGARARLEFDHVDPVACGGRATVERMRLRCRGHNQFEAERVYGEEFMRQKRAAAAVRRVGNSAAGRRSAGAAAARPPVGRVAPQAAEASRSDHPVKLEELLRLALGLQGPRVAPRGERRAPRAVVDPVGAPPWTQAPTGP